MAESTRHSSIRDGLRWYRHAIGAGILAALAFAGCSLVPASSGRVGLVVVLDAAIGDPLALELTVSAPDIETIATDHATPSRRFSTPGSVPCRMSLPSMRSLCATARAVPRGSPMTTARQP